MKQIFSPKPVNQLEELFGRSREMTNAINYLKLGINFSVTAPRRFGKTSFMKMLYKKLENDEQFCPVYLDFTIFAGETTPRDKVYLYILSRTLAASTLQKRFTEELSIDTYTLTPTPSENDAKKQLLIVSDKVDVFEKFLTFMKDEKDITVILLIDEYEILLKQGIGLEDDKTPFMPIRRLFEKGCLQYIISGAENWGKFESKIGSHQLNWTTKDISLPPLCYEDYKKLLHHELDKIQEQHIRKYVRANDNNIYSWSGGVPFYIKIIGAHMYVEHSEPNYKLLQPFFDEILNHNISPNERTLLNQLSYAPSIVNYNLVNEMVNNGFVRRSNDGETYEIAIGFLKDYLNAQSNGAENIIPASYTITKNIVEYINRINSYQQIFCPSIQEFIIIDDMQRPADDRDGIIRFSGAIYKYYWERSNRGENLPSPFQKNNSCLVYAILALRHYYSHNDYSPQNDNQMSSEEMFIYFTDSDKEPLTPAEYYSLQTQVLNILCNELSDILEFVQRNAM